MQPLLIWLKTRWAQVRAHFGVVDLVVLLGLTGLALWLRWPAFGTEGFHNEDVAGITYNADLLRHGLVPLADNLEMKAPGSFYMVWMVWGVFGRSLVVLQRFMAVWSVLGAFGIYAGGRVMYGRRAAVVAALLFTLLSPISDSIDINYGAWMITPYIWSTVFFMAGLRGGGTGGFIASGFTLALAGLLKRQAAVLFPLFAGIIFVALWLARPEGWASKIDRRKALVALMAGLAAGFGLLFAFYLVRGEPLAFIKHYFLSGTGWRYVKGSLSWSEKLPRIGDGFLGFWEYMAVASSLALVGLFSAHRPGERPSARGVLLVGHFWLSFLGAALGLRFFKGYYLQVLPAAVWLAAHPRGLVTRWLSADAWRGGWLVRTGSGAVMLCGALALTPAIMGDRDQVHSIRKRRRVARDLEAQRISRIIKANTTPDDRIWVWGRWAWPVYFHADRLAPTPYYKVLGVVTTNLDNTWRRPTTKTRFVEGGPSEALIADLRAGEPPFIVVSKNEDYSKFKAFRALLGQEYKVVRGLKLRGFRLYRRKGHTWVKRPKRVSVRRGGATKAATRRR